MKLRASLLFVLLIISAIYIFTPDGTVWGGFSMQTVPTIGPTTTPSTTFTQTSTSVATVVTATATSTIVLPTKPQVTVAITLISPVVNETSNPELNGTVIPGETTEQSTQVILATEYQQPTESSGNIGQNQQNNLNELPVETQNDDNSEIKNLPPQWLFPFSGAVFLVVIFLIIKRIIQDRSHNKTSK